MNQKPSQGAKQLLPQLSLLSQEQPSQVQLNQDEEQ